MAVLLKSFPSSAGNVVVNIRAGSPANASVQDSQKHVRNLVSRVNRLQQHSYESISPLEKVLWVYSDQLDAVKPAWNSLENHHGFELQDMPRHSGFGADFQEIENYGNKVLKGSGYIIITDADSLSSSSITDGFAISSEAHWAQVKNLIRALRYHKIDLAGVQQQSGMNRVFEGGPKQVVPSEYNQGGLRIWNTLQKFSYESIRNFFIIRASASGSWDMGPFVYL